MKFVFVVIFFIFPVLASGQNECRDVFATRERMSDAQARAEDLDAQISKILQDNPDLPEYALSEFLRDYYRPLNKEIDRLIHETREQLTSRLKGELDELAKVNMLINAHAERLQKVMQPGMLARFFRGEQRAKEESNELIHEISFCRARSEACVLKMRPEIDALQKYHTDLKNFGLALKGEIKALQDLLTARGRTQSSKAAPSLDRYLGGFVGTEQILSGQLALHQILIEGAVREIETYEINLKNFTRSLMVTTPAGAKSENELRALHFEQYPRHAVEMENFREGTAVYVSTRDLDNQGPRDQFEHELRVFTIQKIEEGHELQVVGQAYKKNTSKLKSIAGQVRAERVALSGCHEGFCTGDRIPVDGVARLRRFEWAESVFRTLGLRKELQVYGYNPFHKSFLVKSADGDSLWVPAKELQRLKKLNGSRVESFTDDLQIGEEVIHARHGKTKPGSWENIELSSVTSLNEGTVEIKYFKGGGKVPPISVPQKEIARLGCLGGLCSGDVIEVLLDKGPKPYSIMVIGFNPTTKQALLLYHGHEKAPAIVNFEGRSPWSDWIDISDLLQRIVPPKDWR